MDKSETLTLRLPAALKDGLKKAAEKDRRTVSQVVLLAIEERLRAGGLLKK